MSSNIREIKETAARKEPTIRKPEDCEDPVPEATEADVLIAFVTPWYGPDIPGGAEMLARTTVAQLQEAGFKVEVLTTTLAQFHSDWGKNHYRPGASQVNGIPVRRFAVEPRDRAAFDRINWRLMNGLTVSPAEEWTFVEEMFRAPGLYEYIAAHCEEYIFFFVAYMFSSTYFGSQICPARSVIIPCLHDESYARLSIYEEMLSGVRALVFNSIPEAELAQRLYGKNEQQQRAVIGMGIDLAARGNAARFREKHDLTEPFVLYIGRREPGKNVPLLLEYWQRYLEAGRSGVKLVLAGPGNVNIPPEIGKDTLDLGFVSFQDKLDAHAAASVLCQPSVHESFSIVLLESWRAGVPVLVHGDCAVTRRHCQLANGGLYFSNYEEFAATLDFILENQEMAATMGQQGKAYVQANFQWSLIVDKYRQLVKSL